MTPDPTSPRDLRTEPSLQSRLDDYWSMRAPAYDAGQQQPERNATDHGLWVEVWSRALPPAPADVVDMGTGSGYVAWLLHDLGYRVTGVDSATGMLAQALTHQQGRGLDDSPQFVLGDALAPPVRPGCADAVTARYVLWTMRDPAVALRAWRDLLRPGGTIALVDGLWFPHGLPSSPDPDPSGQDHDTLEELGELAAPFAHAYGRRAAEDLPLAAATSIDDSAAAISAAGFTDVQVTPLTELYEQDATRGVQAGHQVTQQYLLTGRAPTG